ncbi:type I-E CRISPR-associated protein Cas6/Cse3/CasE [Roseovarius salinarum]|uniref:type I-E CRISPR-associated protein Cas6/Cse3/CasE n=1 Tax=Roseovarius salinarum TaxID=1981892 RepID=UPI000C32CC7E|nr:type I-E CRISPR-associated protein Cas6/Cse3/CasE [Roseovarius salinarum]
MTLYLSRLKLNPDPSTSALAQLLNPRDAAQQADAHHRLIWTVFSDGTDRRRDFLWRHDGDGRFLTLSSRPPRAHDLFLPPETKTFEPDLRVGDRLDFTLRANATKDRAAASGSSKARPKNRRVDVVMDLLQSVPREQRADRRMEMAQTAAEAWMMRQGDSKGFAPRRVIADNYSTIELGRRRRAGATFGILDLSGEIEVTDPELFLPALAVGLGRAKAWGCGLMLIRRAR